MKQGCEFGRYLFYTVLDFAQQGNYYLLINLTSPQNCIFIRISDFSFSNLDKSFQTQSRDLHRNIMAYTRAQVDYRSDFW